MTNSKTKNDLRHFRLNEILKEKKDLKMKMIEKLKKIQTFRPKAGKGMGGVVQQRKYQSSPLEMMKGSSIGNKFSFVPNNSVESKSKVLGIQEGKEKFCNKY